MYPTKKLWEICEIITWNTPRTSNSGFFWWNVLWAWPADIWEEKYIFKTKKTLTEKWLLDGKARLVKKWSVLLVAIGTIWKASIAWCDLTTNQQIHALQVNKDIISEFLYYSFLNSKKELRNQSSNAVLAILNKTKLSNLFIPLPPLPTQQKIVSKLDCLFEKLDQAITLIKQNLANIEELNKSALEKIFKECKGKYEKRKLGEIIILNYWKSAEKNENWLYDVYWANWVMYKSDKFLFDWESIIVWRKWSAGALNKVNWRFWASDVTYFVITNENINYIFNWLKFLNISSLAKWVKPWINRNDVYDLFLSLPPLPEQQKIVEYFDNIFAKNKILQEKYKQDLQNLEELKQSILKQAFEDEDFIK